MVKIVLSFALILSLFLSGCGNRVELNELALILCSAIDLNEKGEFVLFVQILDTHSSSTSQGQAPENVIFRTSKGKTLSDAVYRLQEITSRKLFWGHCDVYILGERLASFKLLDAMDSIARSIQARERAKIFLAKGKGRDILQTNPQMEKNAGKFLDNLVKLNAQKIVTVKSFLEDIKSPGAVLIPRIDSRISKISNIVNLPHVIGMGVIKDGKLQSHINQTLSKGTLWIRDEVRNTDMVIKNPNGKGTISLYPITEKTQLIPSIRNGKWRMHLNITASAPVVENTTEKVLNHEEVVQVFENEMKKEIRQLIYHSFYYAQDGIKADIFNFWEVFHRKYPKEAQEVKGNWNEFFSNVDIDTNVKATLTSTGLLGNSLKKSVNERGRK